MQEIIDFILQAIDLSDHQRSLFKTCCDFTAFDRGERISLGDFETTSFFLVTKGFVREVVFQSEQEMTEMCWKSGDLLGDFSSHIQKTPVSRFFVCETAVSGYLVKMNMLASMKSMSFVYSAVLRHAVALYLFKTGPLLIIRMHYDASKRYSQLQKLYPWIIKYIKFKHVASCLGISPETLSRVKNKDSKCNGRNKIRINAIKNAE